MTQTDALIDALKQALRRHHLTYADLGQALGMSEANVKRQFTSRRFPLDRLEAICQTMNMELSDLFHLYEDSRQRISQLTVEQEEGLVRDTKLLIVAVSVRNRYSFEDLLEQYQLTEPECIQYLAQLDRMKIIDLLPGNLIKLRVGDDFRWIPYGPIEKFFETEIQKPFLKSQFNGAQEQRLFLHGLLTESSIQQLHNRMYALASEFTELLRQDSKMALDRKISVGFLMAMRPWIADVFKSFERK